MMFGIGGFVVSDKPLYTYGMLGSMHCVGVLMDQKSTVALKKGQSLLRYMAGWEGGRSV